jgi:large subunit ribosomal protein L7e
MPRNQRRRRLASGERVCGARVALICGDRVEFATRSVFPLTSVRLRCSISAPESLLLRRKNTARLRAVRAKQLKQMKKSAKSVRVTAFKRAEKYAKEYRVAQKNEIRMKRVARNTGSFYLEPEPKLAFVIRIRG